MTKTEILLETFEYYESDPSRRALDDDHRCRYLTKDGKMCAFGRCETVPNTGPNFTVEGRLRVTKASIDSLLKPQYHGHEVDFWQEVQNWHDHPDNWDRNGLTEIGKAQKYKLLADYA